MKQSIDLGLAIASMHSRRGVRLTHSEIAAYCDCTWNNIWSIEQRAIHKLKRAAMLRGEPELRALLNGSTARPPYPRGRHPAIGLLGLAQFKNGIRYCTSTCRYETPEKVIEKTTTKGVGPKGECWNCSLARIQSPERF